MDFDEYVELLKRGRGQLPEQVFEKSRFEIPKVVAFVEGNRTFITNWRDIVKTLNSEADHIGKFIAREFATSVNDDTGRLILQGKFGKESLFKQFVNYCTIFVICPECKKPDTKLVREGRIMLKACEACGARSNVRHT